MSQGVQLDESQILAEVNNRFPGLGTFLRKVVTALNRTATNAGVSNQGELPTPPAPNQITVKGTYDANNNLLTAPGELLHSTATHNNPLQRGGRYHWEVDTSPTFNTNPTPIGDHTGRTHTSTLPTNDDNGNPVTYYLGCVYQYPGSKPSARAVYGSVAKPIGIQFSGSTNASLLPTQGTGTGRPGQVGEGAGSQPFRPAVGGPKRAI